MCARLFPQVVTAKMQWLAGELIGHFELQYPFGLPDRSLAERAKFAAPQTTPVADGRRARQASAADRSQCAVEQRDVNYVRSYPYHSSGPEQPVVSGYYCKAQRAFFDHSHTRVFAPDDFHRLPLKLQTLELHPQAITLTVNTTPTAGWCARTSTVQCGTTRVCTLWSFTPIITPGPHQNLATQPVGLIARQFDELIEFDQYMRPIKTRQTHRLRWSITRNCEYFSDPNL